MMLLVDLGNTRAKWTGMHGAVLGTVESADSRDIETMRMRLAAWRARPERVLVCSVIGHDGNRLFCDLCRDLGWPEPEFFGGVRQLLDVRTCYQDPARFGADRLMSLVAVAPECTAGAGLVIDCGTAITIDALEAGTHRGGQIIPGIERQLLTLQNVGARIMASEGGDAPLFACDTEPALYAGVVRGLAGGIDRICAEMEECLPAPVTRFLTGGAAETLKPWLQGDYRSEPNLVLRGLARVASE
jgi:type III pantothenate kinase